MSWPGRLILAAYVVSGVGQETVERVLAVVNGDLIMLSDVRAAKDLGLVAAGPDADLFRDILPRWIDRTLILNEVERYAPPEPRDEAIEAALRAVRARFASEAVFGNTLARVGFTEKHLRETVRQDLRTSAYIAQRFIVAPPNDDELGRYYREHPQMFTENGVLRSFEQARPDIVDLASGERRKKLVDDWVAGLRRRADVLDLSTR